MARFFFPQSSAACSLLRLDPCGPKASPTVNACAFSSEIDVPGLPSACKPVLVLSFFCDFLKNALSHISTSNVPGLPSPDFFFFSGSISLVPFLSYARSNFFREPSELAVSSPRPPHITGHSVLSSRPCSSPLCPAGGPPLNQDFICSLQFGFPSFPQQILSVLIFFREPSWTTAVLF